ncbi:hypothetical protein HN51_007851 [Arachis hypogaea]
MIPFLIRATSGARINRTAIKGRDMYLIWILDIPISDAYPIFAQQGYENPREATGRIVCANCHLANKPVDIEVPQTVLPDTVFEAVVRHLDVGSSPPGAVVCSKGFLKTIQNSEELREGALREDQPVIPRVTFIH